MKVYEDYFKNTPASHVSEFNRIHAIVKKLVPEAEEAMMYGVPSFKVNGHFFVGFGSNKNSVSLYPSSAPITLLANKLTDYKTSKGAIPYDVSNPIPDSLLKEIILIRRKAELDR